MVDIDIVTVLLSPYKNDLGKHFVTYRNHCERIFYLSTKIDSTESNYEKYAIAAAFHDLGIWTESTFDYLKPSIALCKSYLDKNNKSDWEEELSLMIDMHHKRSVYKGKFAKTIEVFRKADWIDVTKMPKKYGFNKEEYEKIKERFPLKGFHRFLAGQTIKNFFKHPFKPLPMFKK